MESRGTNPYSWGSHPQPEEHQSRLAASQADRDYGPVRARANRRWRSTRSTRKDSGATSKVLSAYARQFLQLMEKPDVDLIEGLSPAISIEQKATSHNPRSTVGTVTEIHDYLRLLFARVGTPYCPDHHIPLRSAKRLADGRRRARHARGDEADDPRARGGGPQGRARRAVRGNAGAGLHPFPRAFGRRHGQ